MLDQIIKLLYFRSLGILFVCFFAGERGDLLPTGHTINTE